MTPGTQHAYKHTSIHARKHTEERRKQNMNETLLSGIADALQTHVQSQRAQTLTEWVELLLPRLCAVYEAVERADGHWYGWVTLSFEAGELVEIPVCDRGLRLARRKRTAGTRGRLLHLP